MFGIGLLARLALRGRRKRVADRVIVNGDSEVVVVQNGRNRQQIIIKNKSGNNPQSTQNNKPNNKNKCPKGCICVKCRQVVLCAYGCKCQKCINKIQCPPNCVCNLCIQSNETQIIQTSNGTGIVVQSNQCIYSGELVIYNNQESNTIINVLPYKLNLQSINSIKLKHINKLKINNKHKNNNYPMKLTLQKKQLFWGLTKSEHQNLFIRIIWCKIATLNHYSDLYSQFTQIVEGWLYKKSEIIGEWKRRYVRINKYNGLESQQNPNQKPSLIIPQTDQLWTRFQTGNGNKFIVIKMWYKGFIKEEFGIPTDNATIWLKAFYSLLHIN